MIPYKLTRWPNNDVHDYKYDFDWRLGILDGEELYDTLKAWCDANVERGKYQIVYTRNTTSFDVFRDGQWSTSGQNLNYMLTLKLKEDAAAVSFQLTFGGAQ